MNDVLMNGAPAVRPPRSWEDSRRQISRGRAAHAHLGRSRRSRAPSRVMAWKARWPAPALMFTLDGVPLLYNGMEVGDATESGDPALFEKLPIFWSPRAVRPMREFIAT